MSPPEREEPGPTPETGPNHKALADTTNTRNLTATARRLPLRRCASWRLIPLGCGCADPWPCRCSRPPLSDKQVDAVVQAAEHLFDAGYPPIFDVPTLRALWRGHRELAEELAR